MTELAPPRSDELEVSVFGPGVGECIVVHLGDDHWMVVDSCRATPTSEPVAMRYLRQLGKDPARAIKTIVATHWHADHTDGLAALVDAAPDAEFVCSQALRSKEFLEFVRQGDSLGERSGRDEFNRVLQALAGRRSVRWTQQDSRFVCTARGEAWALSPSSATITRSMRDWATMIPSIAPQTAAVNVRPNDTCVAIWIIFGDHRVLLGADLEATSDRDRGWSSIVDSLTRPTGRAGAIKIPHHGSPTAQAPEIWSTLIAPRPHGILTGFARGSRPLPADADIAWHRARTHTLSCTSLPRDMRTQYPHAVQKRLAATTKSARPIRGAMGHVRLRGDTSDPLRVERFGAAMDLS